jgi:hypothetical protein
MHPGESPFSAYAFETHLAKIESEYGPVHRQTGVRVIPYGMIYGLTEASPIPKERVQENPNRARAGGGREVKIVEGRS